MNPPKTTRRPLVRASRRGQAMVEYGLLNWILVVALIIGASVKVRWTEDRQSNVIDLFMEAYQIYYDSFYFVLNLPFP